MSYRRSVDVSPLDYDLPSIAEKDYASLRRLGKKPVLKVIDVQHSIDDDQLIMCRQRNFGFLSILGFACTILVCWESTLIGGSAGLIYGFILVWIGSLAVFSPLSELVSMAPTAGGQYHWVSMLAPPTSQKFFSYITGWLTVCGWQGTLASAAFLSATLIQGLAVLNNMEYVSQPYQATLLFWAVISFAVFMNAIGGTLLPKFEGFILILHILGFSAILIPLIVLGDHQGPSEVFDLFLNTNWPTQGLSFMVGITGSLFVFVGANGAIHMSEEIQNAPVIVPRAIVFTYFFNGILGLGILIATLFCISDLDVVLEPPSGFAFIEIFRQTTYSTAGTTIMVSIITIMQLAATVSILTAASRQLWSFARDRGVPRWRILEKVDQRTTIPIWSVVATTAISCLLSLINLGSSTAFDDIISIAVAGLYSSYLITLSLLLYRRCTGGISFSSSPSGTLTNTAGAQLTWGPWHLPGLYGIIVNGFACFYLTTAFFFTFWPDTKAPSAEDMNYSSLMFGGTILFSVVYYLIRGRTDYSGPIVEVAR
ncbi:hypothetical protein MMC18_006222 [Xylographa bjoerkii]|nr:hypothetical protein [Xylographa bjoerkii]